MAGIILAWKRHHIYLLIIYLFIYIYLYIFIYLFVYLLFIYIYIYIDYILYSCFHIYMYILHINHKSIFIPLFKASSLFSGAILTVNPLSNFREHLITLQFTPGSEGRSGCSQLRGFGSHTRLDHRNLYKAFPLLVQHGHGTPPRFMVSIAKTTKKGG